MGEGLEELDTLLGLDLDDPAARLATDNSEATIGLIAALREARERAGLRQQDVAERMGLKRQSSVADVERLGSDPHLSTLRRYATAIGARLELSVTVEDEATALEDEVIAWIGRRIDTWTRDEDLTSTFDLGQMRKLSGV